MLAFEDYARHDALGLAALIRSGSVSASEVLEAAIERADAANPAINAIVRRLDERARKAVADSAPDSPFSGVPFLFKDLYTWEQGVPAGNGSRFWDGFVAPADFTYVTRCRAAGLVSFGRTATSEEGLSISTESVATGPTRNPWDLGRTAGGSSGGSAAAVAAGLCYAAVGTDTGGSIRIPAAYCGVAGLKPTYGRVPLEGIFPLSWSLDHAGPIARTSTDAALLLDALLARTPCPLDALDLRGRRLVVLSNHRGGEDMAPAAIDAFKETCATLLRAGATLTDASIPDLALSEDAMFPILGPEASAIHSRWVKERPEDYAPLTRLQIELGFTVPALAHVRAQQYRRYLTRQMLDLLAGADAILSPTAPWVAPHKDPAITDDEGAAEGRRTGLYNLTGLPALTVNSGFGPGDLPLGLQIVTRPGADRLALRIGAAFETQRPDVVGKRPVGIG